MDSFALFKKKTITDLDDLMAVTHKISMTIALGGLGCQDYISKQLLFYISNRWSFYDEIRLGVANLKKLYVNDENTFYLTRGINFKIYQECQKY